MVYLVDHINSSLPTLFFQILRNNIFLFILRTKYRFQAGPQSNSTSRGKAVMHTTVYNVTAEPSENPRKHSQKLTPPTKRKKVYDRIKFSKTKVTIAH